VEEDDLVIGDFAEDDFEEIDEAEEDTFGDEEDAR
jgi:succinate dehydrogenase flavin-adding protein (antitoxin of CptAB toxin-antitoxin module)